MKYTKYGWNGDLNELWIVEAKQYSDICLGRFRRVQGPFGPQGQYQAELRMNTTKTKRGHVLRCVSNAQIRDHNTLGAN